ncbi:putative acid proteinase protein [Parachaetomium inaequale]|uniref:Acid proteinase protein n=1 Tax=Parachaetomium inaequale TaxID=2588326 RepID=A0AAN6PHE5_9PEZI|nr:putative acid proteinase protein [Parachaetomium inaequale]
MKLTTAVFAALLSIASAVPQPQVIDLGDGVKLIPRKPRRHRHSRPKLPTSEASIKAITNNTHAEYSTNWAGAILPGSYKSVTGTITYAASAWVGIDGYTCSQPIIQTGIDVYVQGGAVHYDAWYEWWPALAYSFDGFSVGTGDSVTMTVTASSSSAGTVTLKNNSKGKTVTHSFSGEAVKLCQAEAEWIIEDFQLQGQLVPFANFGTVSFTGASATGSDGCAVGVSGSRVINLKKDNKVLTSCSTSGPNTFKCSYVS